MLDSAASNKLWLVLSCAKRITDIERIEEFSMLPYTVRTYRITEFSLR